MCGGLYPLLYPPPCRGWSVKQLATPLLRSYIPPAENSWRTRAVGGATKLRPALSARGVRGTIRTPWGDSPSAATPCTAPSSPLPRRCAALANASQVPWEARRGSPITAAGPTACFRSGAFWARPAWFSELPGTSASERCAGSVPSLRQGQPGGAEQGALFSMEYDRFGASW